MVTQPLRPEPILFSRILLWWRAGRFERPTPSSIEIIVVQRPASGQRAETNRALPLSYAPHKSSGKVLRVGVILEKGNPGAPARTDILFLRTFRQGSALGSIPLPGFGVEPVCQITQKLRPERPRFCQNRNAARQAAKQANISRASRMSLARIRRLLPLRPPCH